MSSGIYSLIAQWWEQGQVNWRIVYLGLFAASIPWSWQKLKKLFGSGVVLTRSGIRRSRDSRRAEISWMTIKSLCRDDHALTVHGSNGEQLIRIPRSVENFFALEDLLEQLAPHLYDEMDT